jgi:chromosome partitioning protein
VAIANQKGGVGKTTTAVNLSSCLAIADKKTLLVDMDPQANATSGLGVEKERLKISIYEVLIDQVPAQEALVKTEIELLDLLPSNIRLVGAEVELVNLLARERKLSPPSLGLLTINTLTAADSVLIPIQCEYYALEGLSQLLNTIKLVQDNLNDRLEVEGVLLTMYDSRLNLANQVVEETRKYFGDKVYNTIIKRNVKLSEAPSFGKPIILYDRLSQGADNYINLAEEVLNHDQTSIGQRDPGIDPRDQRSEERRQELS